MKIEATQLTTLRGELHGALQELCDPVGRDRNLWPQGPSGKWAAGQVVEHVALTLGLFADALEANEQQLRRGTLRRRPWRDPLQTWFVSVVSSPRGFPRGGRAPRSVQPAELPTQERTLERIERERSRFDVLIERLTVPEADRLWIHNPFVTIWHYTFPETVRVQANHARHHARQVAAIAAAS
ncbi:MAG TPA: DinB family protein [Candidatus Limnocylindria bacterium]|nr:DinB family protein [Candidatus Limnocylindria bacterium]